MTSPADTSAKAQVWNALQEDNPTAVEGEFPTPPGWRTLRKSNDGALWRIPGGMTVIATRELHDNVVWVHLSMSHKARLPTWPEMVSIRDALLGPDFECYQVCPPQARYVNLNAHVLHLYGRDDRKPALPRFDAIVEGVRTI